MAAFSYQQPPSFVDSIFYPNSPVGVPSLIEDMNGCCYPSHSLHESCSYENNTKVIVNEHQFDSVSSIEHKTESSPLVIHEVESTQKSSNLPQQKNDMKKKRKTKAKTCADSAHSKCLNEAKVKMQRKCDAGFKTTEKENPTGVKNEKKVSEGSPSGFIHVRARRGQATDSHSLAERVRREKISERMKLLQELVPGCEKVTGKALMLDEIINYVQSLQHQVEFLSMKLASLNPVPYDFTVDFQGYIPEPENMSSIPSHFPQVVNQNYQASFNNSSGATFPELENYGLLDSEVSVSVHHGQQRPNNTFSQDNASLIWRGEEQRQSFLNEVGYDLCSF